MLDKTGQDRFQLKIDMIHRPLFDKCQAILSE